MKKLDAIQLLEKGMNGTGYWGDAYLIKEFFTNFDSECDDLDFIPWLKKLASRGEIYDEKYFDDNGAGGPPHPTQPGVSFETEAKNAIQIINSNYERLSPLAILLKSSNPKIIESTLNEIIIGDSIDISLIPILENIEKEDVYLISSGKARGFGALSNLIHLGKKAKMALNRIRKNIKKRKLKV